MDKTFKPNINMWELRTDSAHALHRVGSDDYTVIRRTIVKDPDDWEEISVEDISPYTQTEYKQEVIKLIREKYDQDDEFAILRKVASSTTNERYIKEYNEYNSFVEDCKTKAKKNLWQRNSN